MDWEQISAEPGLSETFMEENKEYLCWDEISKHQTLTESFMRKMQHYIDWDFIWLHQAFTVDFIERYAFQVKWKPLSQNKHLSKEVALQYKNHINWTFLYFDNNKVFEEVQEQISLEENIHWDFFLNYAIANETLTNEIILTFKQHLPFHLIVDILTTLEHEILEEIKEYVKWDKINYTRITEEQIEQFKQYINWNKISSVKNYNITNIHSFLLQYWDKINFKEIVRFYRLENYTIQFLILHKAVDWITLGKTQKLELSLVKDHISEIDIHQFKKECGHQFYPETWKELRHLKRKDNLKKLWAFLKKLEVQKG